MSSYFRIRLYSVPAPFEDVITGHAFEFGATGVSEALAYSQPDLTYDPDILPVRSHDLDVYFLEKPHEDFFSQLTQWSSQIRWEIMQEENKDWLAEWKKGFAPFQLNGPYWVVPSWFEPPAQAEKPIFIDPGMAFGTGTHATTKMASYFVHKICSQLSDKNVKLLDVGTGTAILAMQARLGGIQHVHGIEIDPEARRVARENIKLNKMNDIEISDKLLEEVREQHDIVVANIIDGVLIQFLPDLMRVLKPEGHIFLTGILLEREQIFVEKFLDISEMQVHRRIEKDEWVGYWLHGQKS